MLPQLNMVLEIQTTGLRKRCLGDYEPLLREHSEWQNLAEETQWVLDVHAPYPPHLPHLES